MSAIVVPRWCEPLIGVPWRATDAGAAGTHCWGLVRLAYQLLASIALPDHAGVAPADLLAVARKMKQGADLEPWRTVVGAWQRLDVIIMGGSPFTTPAEHRHAPLHCGVAVGPGLLIHVEQSTDSVCVDAREPRIAARILSAHRHRDLA